MRNRVEFRGNCKLEEEECPLAMLGGGEDGDVGKDGAMHHPPRNGSDKEAPNDARRDGDDAREDTPSTRGRPRRRVPS